MVCGYGVERTSQSTDNSNNLNPSRSAAGNSHLRRNLHPRCLEPALRGTAVAVITLRRGALRLPLRLSQTRWTGDCHLLQARNGNPRAGDHFAGGHAPLLNLSGCSAGYEGLGYFGSLAELGPLVSGRRLGFLGCLL